MAKTARQVRDTIKKVDLVIEVRDARVSIRPLISTSRVLAFILISSFLLISHSSFLLLIPLIPLPPPPPIPSLNLPFLHF